MGDRYGRKPSHSSALNWARALGSVGWTIPPRGRRLIAVGEAAERVNGREVCAWAAMDVDTRELPAIKATRSRGSMDALPFLGRVLGARKDKPMFVVEGARGTHGPSGSSGLSAAAGRSGTGAGLRGPSAP